MTAEISGAGEGDDEDAYTIGVEEELFLVDAATLDCVPVMPEAFEREARSVLGDGFQRENSAGMVELVTRCHATCKDLRREMRTLRSECARIAGRHGLALMACGTHPFADWRHQSRTPQERYDTVADELQMLADRGFACGLHVHVGIPDAELRIAVMNRIQPHLPLLLALSASSPFWRGMNTGLSSYRTAVNSETPRSGLPGVFANERHYRETVAALVRSGLIPDESYLWWLVRPSRSYPTLELRVTDCCTDVGDAAAIAALYRALVHSLASEAKSSDDWSAIVVQENLWQAARHGTNARFVDCETHECRPVADILDATLNRVRGSARNLCIEAEIDSTWEIVARGSSAEQQAATFNAAIEAGADERVALAGIARSLLQSPAPRPAHDLVAV